MTVDLQEFIEHENAFTVMGELKRLGVITKEEASEAMLMNRADWLKFMKQKAGLLPEDKPPEEPNMDDSGATDAYVGGGGDEPPDH